MVDHVPAVTRSSWSSCDGADCVRLEGVTPGADVAVRPRSALVVGGLPTTAGRVVRDGDDVCFLPRFAFVEGTTYSVLVDGAVVAELLRPRPDRPPTTEVTGIYPSAAEVPRNLLRLYLQFSAPMGEGRAARHVRLVDDGGGELGGALLPTVHELWDAERRRLTVLLDPARIKRGLVSHRELGYPLRVGGSFGVVVDAGYRDARGACLRRGAERRYRVGGDERRHVDPAGWAVAVPSASGVDPLEVAFDRPLDHGLAARCLEVIGPDGRSVAGRGAVGPGERSWRLTPRQPWSAGPHRLVIDPVLEDLAGNSVSRVLDRDLSRAQDAPRPAGPVAITFRPGTDR
jgi:hypothetical protein